MTLQLLSSQQYPRIKSLFDESMHSTLYDQGILAGKYPGKVLVDDSEQPRSAILIKDIWCHLIGDPNNASFISALRHALTEKQFIGEKTNVLFFMDPTEAWRKVLKGLIENREPIETPRYVYVTTRGHQIQIPPLPDECRLVFIDEAISSLVDGELPDDVQKVLDLRKRSDAPDEMGFGYAAIYGRICAAWSVIDFIVEKVGEIRLVTDSRYRRRGMAFLTSAMTINYGLAHGLDQIDWDVAASNIGSISTAKKLGLTLLRTTKEYTLIFPEVGYLINLAWSHLDGNRFEQVHVVAERMINSNKEILIQYGHFLIGAAWAGLDNSTKAFDHLNKAIDAGFDDTSELEGCPSLTKLHGMPEWKQIMERIENIPSQSTPAS
ncbi:MAG TPA: GNAT family N-acetyltransferase [Anaerolineales bacterium]|nr:GNAT family N-acetyltransferase [Anaerolineales bacterium]HNS59489.1 GNAT family N-acetyltransferase [Anaerolineales bacterium]